MDVRTDFSEKLASWRASQASNKRKKSASAIQQAAAREMLSRRQARESMAHFAKYVHPRYHIEPMHLAIAQHLDGVVRGEIKRLMIFAPPQHGKSLMTSEIFPAYHLGRNPHLPVMITSYGAELAYKKSRAVRDYVESPEYKRIFGELSLIDNPIAVRGDSRAVNSWRLDGHRGEVNAAGVSGPLTGNPAALAVIDDPYEGWEYAQSARYREKSWEWYQNTFLTRVWEDGAIVLIQTLWHEDGMAMRILQSEWGKWTVLRLPALAEAQAERDANNERMGLPEAQPDPLGRVAGDAVAPMRFSREGLQERQRNMSQLGWQAEYQAAPRAPEGNRFKRSWFKIVKAVPRHLKAIVRYWDKGGTEGGGAYTAGTLIGIDHNNLTYVMDVVRGQWSSLEREKTIKQTAQLDQERVAREHGENLMLKIYIEQEPGSGGKESAEATIRNLAGYNVTRDLPSGDKDTRLEPFAVQAEAGNVHLLEGAWNLDYIEELIAIPNGKYRDQSDATSGAFNKATGLDKRKQSGFMFMKASFGD